MITPDVEEEKHIVDVVNTDLKEEWVGSNEEEFIMDKKHTVDVVNTDLKEEWISSNEEEFIMDEITPNVEEDKHTVDVVITELKEEWIGSNEEISIMDETRAAVLMDYEDEISLNMILFVAVGSLSLAALLGYYIYIFLELFQSPPSFNRGMDSDIE